MSGDPMSRWAASNLGVAPARPAEGGYASRNIAARFGENPWGRTPDGLVTDLTEFGIDIHTETVCWDEVEDFDTVTPPRPTLHTHVGEFDDYGEVEVPTGIDARFANPIDLDHVLRSRYDARLTRMPKAPPAPKSRRQQIIDEEVARHTRARRRAALEAGQAEAERRAQRLAEAEAYVKAKRVMRERLLAEQALADALADMEATEGPPAPSEALEDPLPPATEVPWHERLTAAWG